MVKVLLPPRSVLKSHVFPHAYVTQMAVTFTMDDTLQAEAEGNSGTDMIH